MTDLSQITAILAKAKKGELDDPRLSERFSRLPMLKGLPSQTKWASTVRMRLLDSLFPFMAALEQSNDQLSCAAVMACRLLFSVDNPDFWINSQEELGTDAWLAEEIEALLARDDPHWIELEPWSAFGFWKQHNPRVARSARAKLREGQNQLNAA